MNTLFPLGSNAYGERLSSPADPPTSHEAAKKVRSSGKLSGHAVIVLKLLRANPGSTFSELFAAASAQEQAELVDDKEVCRRLDTLRKAGLARRVSDALLQPVSRECRVNGNAKTIWEAI